MSSLIAPSETVRYLLVLCLPSEGLLDGFRAGEWTILEDFEEEGTAKLRLHRIVQLLHHLKAKAFVIQETNPQRRGSMVSWRTIARFNEPELYIDPDEAAVASPEALVSWADAVRDFLTPPALRPRQPQSMVGFGLFASGVAAAVAILALFVALRPQKVEFEIDAINLFARQGGVYATLPDRGQPGWYVRVKMHPNGSIELLDRISEADLQEQAKNQSQAARTKPEVSEGGAEASSGISNERLQGLAAAFRARN